MTSTRNPSLRLVRSKRRISLLLVVTIIVGLLTVTSPTALAQSTPNYPSISYGMEGEVVRAWQLIIRYYAPSIPNYQFQNVNGVFDSVTQSNTLNLESLKAEVPDDGYVASSDWGWFMPGVYANNSGSHVRAAEVLLANQGYASSQNSFWGSDDQTAMSQFTADAMWYTISHVDAIAWKYLTWHFVSTLADPYGAVCWTPGTIRTAHTGGGLGYRDPFSTTQVRTDFAQAGASFLSFRIYWGVTSWGPIALNDISQAHGQDGTDHSTHQEGMDLDIEPMHATGTSCSGGLNIWAGSHPAQHTSGSNFSSNYDYNRQSWVILYLKHEASLGGTMPYPYIKRIIFNDWRLAQTYSFMQQDDNHVHDDHLHVTYCQLPPAPTTSYQC